MTDSNPTRPTEPFPPTGPTSPMEPLGSPDPASESDDTSSWFATSPYPSPETASAPVPEGRKRLPARFGTIFWGVLLLAFAGFMIANAVVPFVYDPVTWLIAGLIAAGAVLVIAGIAAAIRRTE